MLIATVQWCKFTWRYQIYWMQTYPLGMGRNKSHINLNARSPPLPDLCHKKQEAVGIVNASDSYFYISMSHFNEMMEDNA